MPSRPLTRAPDTGTGGHGNRPPSCKLGHSTRKGCPLGVKWELNPLLVLPRPGRASDKRPQDTWAGGISQVGHGKEVMGLCKQGSRGGMEPQRMPDLPRWRWSLGRLLGGGDILKFNKKHMLTPCERVWYPSVCIRV